MEKMTIGGFIAHLRKEQGMTQKQLAEKLRVSDKTVSRWEREESLPDLSLVPVLAEVFSVTVEELLQGGRRAPTSPPPNSPDQPGERQLRHILKATKTSYLICCLRSLTISALAILVVLACVEGFTFGHGIDRFSMALTLGIAIQLIAFAHQTSGTIRTMTSLGDDLAEVSVRELRRHLVRRGMVTYGIQVVLTVFSVLLVGSWTLIEWLALGSIWGAGSALVCGAVCAVLWSRLKKRGLI